MSATSASIPQSLPQPLDSSIQASAPTSGRRKARATPSTNTDDVSRPRMNPDTAQRPERNHARGGRAQPARSALLSLRPASVMPATQEQRAASSNSTPAETQFARRGRRRGGHNGQAARVNPILPHARAFGAALTNSETTSMSLQGGAPEFKPGQPVSVPTQGAPPNQQSRASKRRFSRSNAPDISTRIQEDIDRRLYECAICTSEVLRNSKIWSCHTCWTVFHIGCIKQWVTNSKTADDQQTPQNGQLPRPRTWRCPGCNLPQDAKPSIYTCWCGKDQDPRSITGLPPHSCGQTCGKSRALPKKCPHPCELLCHAGPCPPCSHMGPSQICFCGKESAARKCIETNYDTGWSCGSSCGEMMPCGDHACQRPCHEGLCGACEIRLEGRCYCGKEDKLILCCDRDTLRPSQRTHIDDAGNKILEDWTGMFQCANVCDRTFDCGVHQCQKSCHASESPPSHCPSSPDIITHCPCGKTPLEELIAEPRMSCEDQIPKCKELCLKQLRCGHACRQICHLGECMACLQNVDITCRCGRTTCRSICHQGSEESPQCLRTCHTTLNCGRHECGERCCSGERKASERHSSKRKLKSLGSRLLNEDFEAEHICTRMCGRPLKCGNHECQELCHKGPCGTCREAIFDEISCNCGRTVLQPPLPCGTRPPSCRYECERPKACGHPQVAHNCHNDDEACPKCPFLVEKNCVCGKKTLKNQQCWFNEVKCGEVCGLKLKCGLHFCRKTCHKRGDCEDAGKKCQQACAKAKTTCGHPCEDPCHAPYPCKQDKPCLFKIMITCECQNHKKELRCNASRDNEGNKTKSLECDDECAKLERNRKLALALNIDSTTHTDDHVPYAQETLTLFQDQSKWATEQEREFRVLAVSDDEKRLRFKPMPANQRAFLHSLAADFGFDSESMDPEPHRHVAIFKSPRFVAAPNKTLRACIRIRKTQLVSAAAEAAQAKAKTTFASDPYNSFLLTNVKFGLTLEELNAELAAVQGPHPRTTFSIHFLRGGDVVLRAVSKEQNGRAVDGTLRDLRLPLARAFNTQSFGALQLCRVNDAQEIVRLETDNVEDGGWSQVAAKAAAPRKAPTVQPIGIKSSFTVLGTLNKKKDVKVAKKPENVVDDWETAEAAEDEGGVQHDETKAMLEEDVKVTDEAPQSTSIHGQALVTISEDLAEGLLEARRQDDLANEVQKADAA